MEALGGVRHGRGKRSVGRVRGNAIRTYKCSARQIGKASLHQAVRIHHNEPKYGPLGIFAIKAGARLGEEGLLLEAAAFLRTVDATTGTKRGGEAKLFSDPLFFFPPLVKSSVAHDMFKQPPFWVFGKK